MTSLFAVRPTSQTSLPSLIPQLLQPMQLPLRTGSLRAPALRPRRAPARRSTGAAPIPAPRYGLGPSTCVAASLLLCLLWPTTLVAEDAAATSNAQDTAADGTTGTAAEGEAAAGTATEPVQRAALGEPVPAWAAAVTADPTAGRESFVLTGDATKAPLALTKFSTWQEPLGAVVVMEERAELPGTHRELVQLYQHLADAGWDVWALSATTPPERGVLPRTDAEVVGNVPAATGDESAVTGDEPASDDADGADEVAGNDAESESAFESDQDAAEQSPERKVERSTASLDVGFGVEAWSDYRAENQDRLQKAVRRVLQDDPERIVLLGVGLSATQMGEAIRAGQFRPSAIVLLDPSTLPVVPEAEAAAGPSVRNGRALPWPLTDSTPFTRPALTVFWQADRVASRPQIGRWLSSTTPVSLPYADAGRVAGRIKGWLRRRLGTG